MCEISSVATHSPAAGGDVRLARTRRCETALGSEAIHPAEGHSLPAVLLTAIAT
jgi:hypothetical protein